ncbi:MAG: glucose 1-dehydrogenase [Caldilineaceae bacterium]
MLADTLLSEPAVSVQNGPRLHNKVAIITGSARGIGAITAATFVRQGAKVVICDVNEELGRQTTAELNDLGSHFSPNGKPTAIFTPVNVMNPESVDALFQTTLGAYGQIDILVNNAGITRDAQLRKMSEADFELVMEINLKGVFNCGKAAANQMITQANGGVILNAASVVGLDGNFGQTNYAATKAGVIAMTQVWSRELGPKGVRVNAVAPGFIETPMTANMPQKIFEMMIHNTPLRRVGTAQDVANAYLWLASDEASFINGAVIRVDGGLRIGT